jgi:hypothetical protein
MQVLEHREHPAVRFGRGMQPEFVEDAGHVAFDGGYRDDEFLSDAGVGAALGDQRQHLPLAGRQAVERPRRSRAAHQSRDHVGVEHRPALGDAAHRVGEHPQVAHFLFQQVADALRAVGDQGERVRVLQELRQHQHAHSGMGGPDRQCRAQAVVGVLRGHLDVGDDHVRPVRVGQPDEITGIGRRADDVEILVIEDADDTLPNERLILADDDTHPLRRAHGAS